jgi:hypothetical protein
MYAVAIAESAPTASPISVREASRFQKSARPCDLRRSVLSGEEHDREVPLRLP